MDGGEAEELGFCHHADSSSLFLMYSLHRVKSWPSPSHELSELMFSSYNSRRRVLLPSCIFKVGRLGYREVRYLAQSDVASQWQSQDYD